MIVALILYFWICGLFSLVYNQRRYRRGELDWTKEVNNPDAWFYFLVFAIGMCWWYWPVMIYNLVSESQAEKAKELKRFMEHNGG